MGDPHGMHGMLGAMLGVAPVFWASAALLITSGMLSRRSNYGRTPEQ